MTGRRARLRAFTLIEVVAALAILGGLLTAASLARSRLARQDRVSRDRQLAVALLGDWADRNWGRRSEWSAWAKEAGTDELRLVDEENLSAASQRAIRWRLELEAVDLLEPRVEGVVPLRLTVSPERGSRASASAPLAVLDVLVPATPPAG